VKRSRTAFFDLARGQAQRNIRMANGLESLVHMAKLGHACVKQHESLKINIICNKNQLSSSEPEQFALRFAVLAVAVFNPKHSSVAHVIGSKLAIEI
jgi:hypothetical protein